MHGITDNKKDKLVQDQQVHYKQPDVHYNREAESTKDEDKWQTQKRRNIRNYHQQQQVQ